MNKYVCVRLHVPYGCEPMWFEVFTLVLPGALRFPLLPLGKSTGEDPFGEVLRGVFIIMWRRGLWEVGWKSTEASMLSLAGFHAV